MIADMKNLLMHRNNGARQKKGLISDPIYDYISPTPYPFNISIFESTPPIYNLTYARVIYCPMSTTCIKTGSIYCPMYGLYIKNLLSNLWPHHQDSVKKMLTHYSPFQEWPYSGIGWRRKLLVLSLHHCLQRLVWNLRSYLVVEEHFVSSIYLFTCLPAYLVPVYLDGVIPGRYSL